jgi:hypothetical protein
VPIVARLVLSGYESGMEIGLGTLLLILLVVLVVLAVSRRRAV